MKHHILIPTDFSDNAWTAAKYALQLYANEACTFYFSHAWTFINSGVRTQLSESYIKPFRDEAKANLAEVVQAAKAETSNDAHEFESIFSIGSVEDAIEFAVKEKGITMVVMGTKGASGAQEFLFGSNTVSVVNKMRSCPVLLVPDNFSYRKPLKIVFPSDFNRFFGDELQVIRAMADLHNSHIDVLHIHKEESLNAKQKENVAMLKTYFEAYKHQFNWLSDSGKKEQAITTFIKEENADMLTMINYEHSFVENLIKEPVIKKMGYHSLVPFLVIPRVD
ncbi:universal stress protein [Bizionia sediminis]|uniref:Universal stress protein n=1 Tax=Bizionia sediminis TaxID=1737064 RepID=A0ABW5KTD9_9FLAO